MSGLTVRHFERREVDLPVEFVIGEPHQDQVRFSATSSALGAQCISATTIDISLGGMGLRSRHFIPRMCEGRLRVFDPRPVGKRADGSAIYQVAFEEDVKVRRVSMTGHEPSYFIGVAFMEPSAELEQRILKLMDLIQNRQTAEAAGHA